MKVGCTDFLCFWMTSLLLVAFQTSEAARVLGDLGTENSLRGSEDGLQQSSESSAKLSPNLRALVINHSSIGEFCCIPLESIRAASHLKFLFRHASIGANIDLGLNCLMNSFPGRDRRPNFCDRGIPPGQEVFDKKYNRSNWIFEWRGNPGWWDKVKDFKDRIDQLPHEKSLDIVAFNFNYGDAYPGSAIANKFFGSKTGQMPNVDDLEDLEVRHPGLTFVWWTMALARMSTPESKAFNERLRLYAAEHKKVLLDLADIESHRPDGSPCVDNRGLGIEAICEEYTNEKNSGHLNSLGSQRVAKAIWVMMARLSGWKP